MNHGKPKTVIRLECGGRAGGAQSDRNEEAKGRGSDRRPETESGLQGSQEAVQEVATQVPESPLLPAGVLPHSKEGPPVEYYPETLPPEQRRALLDLWENGQDAILQSYQEALVGLHSSRETCSKDGKNTSP